MFKKFLLVLIAFGFSATSAFGGTCVKVRSGKDGYECMKFSKKQRQNAAKFGLKLGAQYEAVKRHLIKNGWSLDHAWIEENLFAAGPQKGDLICGSGYDAVCSTAYRKNEKTISLLFSGTNAGIPLIDIESASE